MRLTARWWWVALIVTWLVIAGFVSLALDESRTGPVSDLQDRGRELPDAAGRNRTADLPRRAAVSVPQTAEWDVSHESTNPSSGVLLAQFETLVSTSETSLEASEATSKQLRTLSETVRKRLDKIEQKQSEIERFQAQLLRSFNTQTEQTMNLVRQVNALLEEE